MHKLAAAATAWSAQSTPLALKAEARQRQIARCRQPPRAPAGLSQGAGAQLPASAASTVSDGVAARHGSGLIYFIVSPVPYSLSLLRVINI